MSSDLTPTPKIQSVTLAGAVAVVLVWVGSLAGLDIPGTVEAAFTLIIAAAAGYLTRDRTSPPPRDADLPPVIPPLA
jgi:hypothetical protein